MSQETRILAHLKKGRSLTPIEALREFNCFRLGARIHGLRSRGHKILSQLEMRGNKKFARYRMACH